ncbi:MAG TPA: HAMP domain-containing sensor histidine kinase [Vicinamibacterales bacterium]|nr:HAMP domain-containing sensor histidine kinase [Vicinamibacterales bacterium]
MARGTIGLRLSLWYAVVFVGSTVVLVGLTYALLASSLAQRDHDIIAATLQEYASRYETGGLPALEQSVELEQRTGSRERLFVRVLGPDADALFVSVPPGWGDFQIDRLGEAPGGRLAAAPARDRSAVLEVASARLPDGTILQVGKSNEIRLSLLRQFRTVVGWVSVLAMVVGVIGGLILTRSTLQPIHDIIHVAQGIVRTGRTNERVPTRPPSGDAVDELGALVNAMLDRITKLIGAMGDSLDNVAHDLRTPMARLRGRAERALEGNDPAAIREALADCLEESEHILSMLDTLMDISEAETGVLRLVREPVNLRALLADVVDLYEDVADSKHVALALEAGGDVVVSGAPDRLRQAFANLVDNAVKYTHDGGRVTLTAARSGGEAVVTVTDTGMGIAESDLPRIWDRLYRADPSRSERGLGLGLSLVKAYVQAHGGSVEAASTPGRGSTFTVRLPA